MTRIALSRCVVVGGAGAVGSMFVQLLASARVEVAVVDRRPPRRALPEGVRFLDGDIAALSDVVAGVLADADIVVLALPEPVVFAVAGPVRSRMPTGALLVQTMSVQSGFSESFGSGASRTELLGLNPLFAPSLAPAGRGVAAVVLHGGPRTEALIDLLTRAGADVVRLAAEEHDKLMAAAQVATHAAALSFGLALRQLGVDLSALSTLAPPPYRVLLALTARISGGTPEVYWDIQSANPYAAQARAALRDGVDTLATTVASGSEESFAAILSEVSAVFGDRLAEHQRLCTDLFESLAQPCQRIPGWSPQRSSAKRSSPG